MILGNSGAHTLGTDGVATVRLADSSVGYLAGQLASGDVPFDRQVQPNSLLTRAPAGEVECSGWQAWVTGRRRALGGRG
ncbi:hypothetical protein NOVOSPHI9U_290010 [Novosphingobium sp. 9U]|nr:hypothetical protein NOVOSPHI9U_290010 [Novosphingobium sp. 9U]